MTALRNTTSIPKSRETPRETYRPAKRGVGGIPRPANNNMVYDSSHDPRTGYPWALRARSFAGRLPVHPGVDLLYELGPGYSPGELVDILFSNIGLRNDPNCSEAEPPAGATSEGKIFSGGICPLQTENHPMSFFDNATTVGAGTYSSKWFRLGPGFGQWWFRQTKQWSVPNPQVYTFAFPMAPPSISDARIVRSNPRYRRGTLNLRPSEQMATQFFFTFNKPPRAQQGVHINKPPTDTEVHKKGIFKVGIVGVAASGLGEAGEFVDAAIRTMPKVNGRNPCAGINTLQGKVACMIENENLVDWREAIKDYAKGSLQDVIPGFVKRAAAGKGRPPVDSDYYNFAHGPTTGWAFTRPPRVSVPSATVHYPDGRKKRSYF